MSVRSSVGVRGVCLYACCEMVKCVRRCACVCLPPLCNTLLFALGFFVYAVMLACVGVALFRQRVHLVSLTWPLRMKCIRRWR